MFYVRTGANGACKSLFTLKDVRDKQIKEGRPVCVIVGGDEYKGRDPQKRYVKIKPETMAAFGWSTCEFKDWQKQPFGTIFFADECHNYMPKRPNASAVPPHITNLAEHRAGGYDFFFLTQHPSNLDQFFTKLVGAPGWHEHLKRVMGGTNVTSVLRWDAVNMNCEKNGSAKSAHTDMRTQPKEVYAWYDSAELHTAKVRVPKQVWYIVGGIPIVVGLIWFVGQRMTAKIAGTDKPGAVAPGSPGQSVGAGSGAAQEASKVMTTMEYVVSYQPRIPGLMHTAPAYDELTKPKRVPVPAACIESKGKGCKCYTQDATPYPVDLAMCRQLVAHGAFLAFQPEGEQKQQERPQQTAAPAPQNGPSEGSGLILIGGGATNAPAASAPADPLPQRIASVKR